MYFKIGEDKTQSSRRLSWCEWPQVWVLQASRLLNTVHRTPPTIHCPQYTVHCPPYTAHCPLSTVHCRLSTVDCRLSLPATVHCPRPTVHMPPSVPRRPPRSLLSVRPAAADWFLQFVCCLSAPRQQPLSILCHQRLGWDYTYIVGQQSGVLPCVVQYSAVQCPQYFPVLPRV
jgi:hypothetical protein